MQYTAKHCDVTGSILVFLFLFFSYFHSVCFPSPMSNSCQLAEDIELFRNTSGQTRVYPLNTLQQMLNS